MLTEMGVMPEHQGSLSPPLLQYRTFEFAGWGPRGAPRRRPFNLAENRKWSRRTGVKVIIAASWLCLYTSRVKRGLSSCDPAAGSDHRGRHLLIRSCRRDGL